MTVTEQEFIASLRNSNEEVFEVVFKSYYGRLCNFANTFVGDTFEAEEMVQHTFLTIWENREEISIHTSLKSYLYRSVHNNCLNRIKHLKVRKTHSDRMLLQCEPSFDNASQHIISSELEAQINKAVQQMPQQCRTVFVLSRFENCTYAEIAEQLGISIKTVEKHMMKALKIMREELKEYLPYLLWILTFNSLN